MVTSQMDIAHIKDESKRKEQDRDLTWNKHIKAMKKNDEKMVNMS